MNQNNQNIELERKDRPDDVLGHLPLEDQRKIIFWLSRSSIQEVVKRIALPPPEGLGIDTHYTSVRRFYAKHIPQELRAARMAMIEDYRALAGMVQAEPAPWAILAREQIEKQLFDLTLDPYRNSEALQRTLQMLLSLRSQDLKEKYYDLHRERLEIQRGQSNGGKNNLHVFAAMQGQVQALLAKSVPDSNPTSE